MKRCTRISSTLTSKMLSLTMKSYDASVLNVLNGGKDGACKENH